eukprot:6360641-Pyramimonas_sp.AAC.1
MDIRCPCEAVHSRTDDDVHEVHIHRCGVLWSTWKGESISLFCMLGYPSRVSWKRCAICDMQSSIHERISRSTTITKDIQTNFGCKSMC